MYQDERRFAYAGATGKLHFRPWLLGCLLLLLMPSPAQAHRVWAFTIFDDGRPCFQGGIGEDGRVPPIEVVRSYLCTTRINLGTDSTLAENTTGDVTLKGNVEFRFQDLPPVRLESLRLLYSPNPKFNGQGAFAGGDKDWILHPEDTSIILAELNTENNVRRLRERFNEASSIFPSWTRTLFIGLGVGFASGIACSIVWRRFQRP